MSMTIRSGSRVSRFAATPRSSRHSPARGAARAVERERIECIDATAAARSRGTIQLKSPPAGQPASFSVNNPRARGARLPRPTMPRARAFDLPQGDVRNGQLVQSGSRSRVVLNLKRPLNYNITVEGSGAGHAHRRGGAPCRRSRRRRCARAHLLRPGRRRRALHRTRPARPRLPARQGRRRPRRRRALRSRHRRRHPPAGPDHRRRLPEHALPENLAPPRRRRLRHAGVAVRATQQGDNARLVIEPHGLWEHNAYQSDTQFVVEVRP